MLFVSNKEFSQFAVPDTPFGLMYPSDDNTQLLHLYLRQLHFKQICDRDNFADGHA